MKELVAQFVDGSGVDLVKMFSFGLIKKHSDGWVLTQFGKSFLPGAQNGL